MADTGKGSSLGRALLDAIRAAAGAVAGRFGRKSTYNRTEVRSQLVQLVGTGAGYEALNRAGLNATRPQLQNWLEGVVTPNAANRAKIQEAYDQVAGKWPPGIERQPVRISGQVRTGGDSRDRGANQTAPFLVDGSEGDWSRIREAWEAGAIDADDAEEWFTDDVVDADPALDSSEPWEFPGTSYTVVIG